MHAHMHMQPTCLQHTYKLYMQYNTKNECHLIYIDTHTCKITIYMHIHTCIYIVSDQLLVLTDYTDPMM